MTTSPLNIFKSNFGKKPFKFLFDISFSCFEASKNGISSLIEYLANNENPNTIGIEEALFYDYQKNNKKQEFHDYYNEMVFIVLIANGYMPKSDLFGLYICGSIYDAMNIIQQSDPVINDLIMNNQLFKDFMNNYIDMSLVLTYDELMVQANCFVHYTYDFENAFNQQIYIDALDKIPVIVNSFMKEDGITPLFHLEIKWQ